MVLDKYRVGLVHFSDSRYGDRRAVQLVEHAVVHVLYHRANAGFPVQLRLLQLLPGI